MGPGISAHLRACDRCSSIVEVQLTDLLRKKIVHWSPLSVLDPGWAGWGLWGLGFPRVGSRGLMDPGAGFPGSRVTGSSGAGSG